MKLNIGKAVATIGGVLASRKAEILVAAGIAGFATTVFMTGKAAVAGSKIVEDIENIKMLEGDGIIDEEQAKEDIRKKGTDLVRIFAPVAVVGGLSVACIIASNRVQNKQIAVLTSAYAISEKTLKSYQEMALEDIGEETHQKIMDRIAQNEAPFDRDYEQFVETEDGDTLFYDRVTGRYFKSTTEKIKEAENIVLKHCIDECRTPLNDFYSELGLEDNSFIGDAIGWDIEIVKPDIYFTSMLSKDGQPCKVINYNVCIIDSRIFGSNRRYL